ncbi:hypothetical protein IWQ55_006048 [Labrenzia sp. EL_208]|nr:hypothetical protein [Labrenzia sp. EL_132]MBG6232815.1 hypothetical protein [Labrenzia sp. EL_208]
MAEQAIGNRETGRRDTDSLADPFGVASQSGKTKATTFRQLGRHADALVLAWPQTCGLAF